MVGLINDMKRHGTSLLLGTLRCAALPFSAINCRPDGADSIMVAMHSASTLFADKVPEPWLSLALPFLASSDASFAPYPFEALEYLGRRLEICLRMQYVPCIKEIIR